MNSNKEYLIYLLSCFLNGEKPEGREVDWSEVYRLADINDICGIVATEIKKLDAEAQPQGEVKSRFIQNIGYAVRRSEIRDYVIERLRSIFNELNTDFIFVKGAAINKYYPSRELRTSGDIDVVVRNDRFDYLVSVFENSKYNTTDFNIKGETLMFYLSGVFVEIHTTADVDNAYFDNIFDLAEKCGDYEYSLSVNYHLIFVLLHLIKHMFADRGAGIRMLMDLDVLIRSINNFSEDEFYSECDKAGELNNAKLFLSVASEAFNTPVKDKLNFKQNKEIYDSIIDVMLDGGSFGYVVQSTGFYHYYVNNDSDKGVNTASKVKAVIRYIFPPVSYVRGYREYSKKHLILTPLAYAARAKDAFFKRRKKALSTFSQIVKVKDEDIVQRKFLENIDENNDKKEQ